MAFTPTPTAAPSPAGNAMDAARNADVASWTYRGTATPASPPGLGSAWKLLFLPTRWLPPDALLLSRSAVAMNMQA